MSEGSNWPRPYSQHLIFFVTYEWAQLVSVFVLDKPFQPCVMKHSSLLVPLLSYEENEALLIRPPVSII
jgi:hypothetical protein